MARKGIEEMISEIEIFIDNCKYQPLSSSKIIVPKEDLEQMVGELKLKLPNVKLRLKLSHKEVGSIDYIISLLLEEANKLTLLVYSIYYSPTLDRKRMVSSSLFITLYQSCIGTLNEQDLIIHALSSDIRQARIEL